MKIHKGDTALVVIDPQNDVLSEKGFSWGLVGASVKENNMVENIAKLFQTAKEQGYGVFISPHYLYPADQAWQFGGPVEKMMLERNVKAMMMLATLSNVSTGLSETKGCWNGE